MIQIPLALDHHGELASALTALKHVSYTCLECGGSLHVRRGETNIAHFAHTAHDTQGCSGESVIHRAAKRVLRQQLEAELAQDGHVQWVRHCPGVQTPCRMQAVLPERYNVGPGATVLEEVTYGRYRFDVAVLIGPRVVFGFEVYHRHAVPREKAEGLNVPWLELVAEEILEFKPRVPWRDSVGVQHCQDCMALQRALVARLARDAQRGKQTERYVAEVLQVKHTWEAILLTAGWKRKL
ncbi:competence protein CoiA family protein [Deinococcus ruber]|uniref:Competence protein CoiA-like N-terminal domain-containing protein n=1 Tax=Deinococcus ruber TaxID=1848197 RepID=A0A918CGX1_9DEIO|nr:competence protein CoiA family protein [Deinococcus ruber]GGR21271.1 hypothetical protein GCM10008957_36950 [Deinococcus ruber]